MPLLKGQALFNSKQTLRTAVRPPPRADWRREELDGGHPCPRQTPLCLLPFSEPVAGQVGTAERGLACHRGAVGLHLGVMHFPESPEGRAGAPSRVAAALCGHLETHCTYGYCGLSCTCELRFLPDQVSALPVGH